MKSWYRFFHARYFRKKHTARDCEAIQQIVRTIEIAFYAVQRLT